MGKIAEGISRITLSPEGGHDFTRAIMTTDTRPKEIAVRVQTAESSFTIGGTAKGAGMIHPNMATMLGFLTTDAAVEATFLKEALTKAVDTSFNMITVDGDTSTNDTVLLMANGRAGNRPIEKGGELAGPFHKALQQVCLHLAKCVAKDGEGATRLIEVQVDGAQNRKDARLAARTIAGSPLVKSAVHGCDPNWGRIIAAAGRSGAELVEEKADVFIGEMCLMKSGVPQAFDKKDASAVMGRDEVLLRVDLNLGKGRATAWGCDLSEEYVVINSEYTT
jgi:glutamate N-acetyltransferase/amino-acid N-acetyltransferase